MTIFGIIFFVLLVFVLTIVLGIETACETSVFGSTLITAVIFGIFLGLGYVGVKHEKSNISGATYISSLSASSNLSGRFFLGSGTVENKNYYYYVTNSDKGYQIDKMEITNDIYIREDCNNKPFIEYTKYHATYINWFGKLFFKKSFYNKSGEIIFHVPPETIIGDYYIDVNNL